MGIVSNWWLVGIKLQYRRSAWALDSASKFKFERHTFQFSPEVFWVNTPEAGTAACLQEDQRLSGAPGPSDYKWPWARASHRG